MDTITLVLFVLGLVVLVVGAEVLVRGASNLASAFGISPLVIGLTVVAYGTSAPELAVGIQSSIQGQPGIVMGNVIGSNISNILLILGTAALFAPLIVDQQLIRLEVPIMIGVSVFMLLLALDGNISRIDGLILFVCIIAHAIWSIRSSRKENEEVRKEYSQEHGNKQPPSNKALSILIQVAYIVAGLGLLVMGSDWLVDGAVAMARFFGVSDLIIGLTIVAVGTSLPELATSIVAVMRGERDIAVGNVIGSNISNILAILGITGIFAPNGIAVAPEALGFDIPVMIAVALACLPIFFTGHVVARWEGGLFLTYYIAYLAYLVLIAMQHPALPVYSNFMLLFIIPITVITLGIITIRALRDNRDTATGQKQV
ncbi:MAG: calcium/sodium antiporter [Chloroflexi bacterium AL-W]|nr:calcium/sodium antiporter [Chloroflexi bacterium AL-N1]NOK69642.1 calcium/sodium antiporter [Chloroflexi bacterium AL-N10]NOK72189.1 calcium/sodium antiporter [Chloroflexi bacterium AL-N5]NOK85018.1 calcium/sodium antiporter [Chloroflexi bacterium AL-W]NOK91771.1 calcium/sodium antiporter [Chloroflexi bacterium AL-N15]